MPNQYRYIFYYPSKYIGGAQMLFYRLAKRLIADGCRVHILVKGDCFISNHLRKDELPFSSTDLDKEDFVSTQKDYHIASASHLVFYFRDVRITPKTRMVFWELHPYASIESLNFSRFYKKQINKSYTYTLIRLFESRTMERIARFINISTKHGGYLFMCGKNHKFTQKYFPVIDDVLYLPIPLANGAVRKTDHEYSPNDKINVGWLGRIDKDKFPLVEMVINDFMTIDGVNIIIIGDGNNLEYLKSKYQSSRIVFKGRLQGEDLNRCMKIIDVGVSIGTAALEFASRGIATSLMPGVNEHNDYGKNKYIWLNKVSQYNLTITKDIKSEAMDAQGIIDVFRIDANEIAKRCYHYFKDHHDIDSIYHRLINQLNDNTLTMEILLDENIDYIIKSELSKFIQKIK